MKKFRGDFLRELRKKKGLSQAQTGKVAGVAGPTVGTWERGVSAPSAPTVKMLAEYFGIEESDFWESPAPSGQSDRDIYHLKTQGDILRHVAALVSAGFLLGFATNKTTGKDVVVLHSPDIDKDTDLW
ncbi:MAG: helix-turn-helix domain-containing protein, partial [Clostridiales bacterium]|nr:helix-turn-helix domain-containing protein [Clostridiales bacterium]